MAYIWGDANHLQVLEESSKYTIPFGQLTWQAGNSTILDHTGDEICPLNMEILFANLRSREEV